MELDKLLTSLRVLQAHVELTVLALRRATDAGTGLGHKAVVEQGEGARITGQNAGNSASIAARSSIAHTSDYNSRRRRFGGGGAGDVDETTVGNRSGKSQGQGEEGSGETHSEKPLVERFKSGAVVE